MEDLNMYRSVIGLKLINDVENVLNYPLSSYHNLYYMKTLFLPLSRIRSWLNSSSRALLPAALALGLAQHAQAQSTFPRFEAFTSNTVTDFRLGGSPNPATLTGTSSTDTNGFLRLTDASTFQSGFIIDQRSFPAPQGFSISFEFFSHSGTGADGFSVFLVDADKTTGASFTPGAPGGALGYTQRDAGPVSNGVPNGYIGIGIDEFGNFANPGEGRIGGPGVRADAVSIRGSGNGSTGYAYIAGSGTLPFSLDVGAAGRVTNPSNPNYRRAYIDVIPQGTAPNITYKITVRIQHGNAVTTAIDNVTVTTPPQNLRIGFAGSTGGNTNVHEIRNLSVVQSPIANDDLAGTIYNQPVTFNALNNDQFFGSNFKLGSVDLDITTPTVDSIRTVTAGTFKANRNGTVTFTPSGTFAGVVTIPYLMQDVAGSTPTAPNPQYFSNPANITIIVEGADLATSVSGPASANPGSRITYTVNTSNLGTQVATNVVPIIRLPTGLSNVVVPNGSYDSTSGIVTFGTIATLTPTDAPVFNTVTFTVPVSGPITSTATFQTPPAIPDPVASNNAATITTVVTGVADIATACATPGKDGPGALNASTSPNTYYPGVSVGTANGTSTITVGVARTGAGTAATAVAVNDLVLIMQMQGADITTTATSDTYGTVTANNNYTAGKYEYAIVRGVAAGTGNERVLTLAKTLTNTYSTLANTTTAGQRRFQVIRIPQYSSLSISSGVTGANWDGNTGGVLALDVAGRTTFATGSSLSMSARGFRGGGASIAGTVASTSAYASASDQGHGSKGEGTAGTPFRIFNGTAIAQATPTTGYPIGSHAAGAPGNAGGGATDRSTTNSGNAGGGGGSNGGNGGTGGYGSTGNNSAGGLRAIGGRNVSDVATASRIFMGGGGGSGSVNTGDNATLASGAVGGGIIIFRTGLVSGTGTIAANGGTAASTNTTQGGGGGGAGGTIIVLASPPGNEASGLNGLTVSAIGGAGGSVNNGNNDNSYGPGGGGGGGYIYTNSALAGSNVDGGANGVTNDGSRSNSIAYGAGPGTAGVASTDTAPTSTATIAGASSCLPVLSMALATSTPNVVRPNGTTVNPAVYTLTVSNTGGAATDVSAQVSMNALFGYDNTFAPVAVQTTADGTTSPVTIGGTLPSNGVSTPTFSGLSIPAGASLRITFRATIATSAVNNFAYQASGRVNYTNPLRTVEATTTTISPGNNYTGSASTSTALGTAGGNNYTGTSTAEDVTITRPLPVELKRFDVAASGLNAELTWATASELQNDHFNIERSLDGKNFERIHVVKGQGTSPKEVAYRYTDAGAGRLSLKPIYYRLQQVDLDGNSSYSPVRIVKFERGTKAAIALYPNPHQGTATLDLTALPTLDSQVEVMDISGRLVGKFQLLGGLQHPLDLHALPLGSYLVRVRNAETVVTLPMIRN
ncbi:cadherin-like domain-containing protein [Hymenobacter tibetensis]|uniref:Cadherin-like domain-containing protein n=1 Tax=Hymenobacter tibetensis TaxID=497967 RepID=A0ABY4D3H6_9BACT|nr:T9SS type A sorting domain-containing protein [Hymenobacter tibetensis]UOG76757.1 cadherin-like domain-containing protein [Hymenobacter tibetensis]